MLLVHDAEPVRRHSSASAKQEHFLLRQIRDGYIDRDFCIRSNCAVVQAYGQFERRAIFGRGQRLSNRYAEAYGGQNWTHMQYSFQWTPTNNPKFRDPAHCEAEFDGRAESPMFGDW